MASFDFHDSKRILKLIQRLCNKSSSPNTHKSNGSAEINVEDEPTLLDSPYEDTKRAALLSLKITSKKKEVRSKLSGLKSQST